MPSTTERRSARRGRNRDGKVAGDFLRQGTVFTTAASVQRLPTRRPQPWLYAETTTSAVAGPRPDCAFVT